MKLLHTYDLSLYQSIPDVTTQLILISHYTTQYNTTQASRWDVYLSMDHAVSDKVHWFSIVNSVLIVLFLAFMVAMILVRTLHKDISRYNQVPGTQKSRLKKIEVKVNNKLNLQLERTKPNNFLSFL